MTFPLKLIIHFFIYTSVKPTYICLKILRAEEECPQSDLERSGTYDESLQYHIDNIFTDEVWLFIPSILIILFVGWYFGMFDKTKGIRSKKSSNNNKVSASKKRRHSTKNIKEKSKSKKIDKKDVIKQYKKDNDLPETLETGSDDVKLFKRDMTGLMAYFKEMTNIERLFNEMTGAIRNGYTVKKYLNDAGLMDNPETRRIMSEGFGIVAGFLKDMLEINENPELRKDYDACIEAVKILKQN